MTGKTIDNVETANINKTAVEDKRMRIKFKDFHSKQYLDNLRKTTYKDKKVVFVLPNGKEY